MYQILATIRKGKNSHVKNINMNFGTCYTLSIIRSHIKFKKRKEIVSEYCSRKYKESQK
jgi:hypothetical protein